ncbi:hypothetical protein [Pseudomonas aeruginosa]|uniref:hypothetical protein n=1 Tax=Pseudomonas aeruginosa TaxID=287 RepID=UPI000F837188|nr:hypothetical protein [Pseudomonas aeruginosa]ELK4818360.1 hypothetical protein [Pseudomonas aeruginosa]ELK4894141.1 hypothetical protein [Pseudomonas aeruginosa]MCF3953763.1 hypothetical protein [Pseudomonas aeruginosa]MDV6567408.1 hypothetical protein [Pseudomonas aeruginosa]MDX4005600.1 hypothetical protein [Pseudomonas aeruginosa]
MEDLKQWKEILESICEIIKWHPSDEVLLRIKRDLRRAAEKGRLTEEEVRKSVAEHAPNALYKAFEGIDQADIQALLAIAVKLTRK